MSEREFLGIWIPAEVWLDTRLTITEKAFLAEVEALRQRQSSASSKSWCSWSCWSVTSMAVCDI